MIRSTLAISAALAAVSVTLTALWVPHGPRSQADQARQASAVVPIFQQRTTDSNGQPIRSIATAPSPGSTLSDVSDQKDTPAVRTATLATRPPSDAYSASPVSPDLPGDGRSPVGLLMLHQSQALERPK
jgi:hypothetical protein